MYHWLRRVVADVFIVCLAAAVLASCGSNTDGRAEDESVTISVAAASDLQFAFAEIGGAFEEETGHTVEFNFGSTGQFATQIERGAPFDVFAAANVSFIDDLIASGDIIADSREQYAIGRIVLASSTKAGIDVQQLSDLQDQRIRWIAIANPDHAPYGVAAREALQRAGIWDAIQDRLVLGENIRQTLQIIELGEADAGIVALSIADVEGITFTLIDDSLHEPILQAIGVTTISEHPDVASEFVAFVMSPEGGEILAKYGFERPDQ